MQDALRLSEVADSLARAWSLEPGEPYGETSIVVRTTRADGARVVLKVGRRYAENRAEAEGLRVWNGNGVVRLLEAWSDDEFYALLLERCEPALQLRECLPEEEQDSVIAALLQRLWIEPPPNASFSSLQEMCEQWAVECESRHDQDLALIRDGVTVWKELAVSGERSVLLHTDLHAGNVLASQREPWLAIDPKPFVGDPAYDVLQHMTNCPTRLAADPRALCDRMAAMAGVNAIRVRQWMFGRLIVDPDWPFGTTGSPTNYDVARRLL